MTELTGSQWTGNQWTVYSGSILVTQQINHRPRCLKNIKTTHFQISFCRYCPPIFPCTLEPSGSTGNLPPLCVVPGPGAPGVHVCLRSRGVPTAPHYGSVPGAPAPHSQGWGCPGGMAVPSGFFCSKASINTLEKFPFLWHCFSDSFNNLSLIM